MSLKRRRRPRRSHRRRSLRRRKSLSRNRRRRRKKNRRRSRRRKRRNRKKKKSHYRSRQPGNNRRSSRNNFSSSNLPKPSRWNSHGRRGSYGNLKTVSGQWNSYRSCPSQPTRGCGSVMTRASLNWSYYLPSKKPTIYGSKSYCAGNAAGARRTCCYAMTPNTSAGYARSN